jgi:heavy metal translocating P-type ATPase
MRQLKGVDAASVSFTTESMEVSGSVSLDEIESRLKELGYRMANEADAAAAMAAPIHTGFSGFAYFLWEQPPLRTAIMVAAAVLSGLLIIPAMGVSGVMGIPALSILFGAAVLVAGAPVFMKGLRALIFARRITIDLLMAIAAIGALAIGETGEACTVILLFMLGEALEAYSAERARDSLRTLMSLQPQEATVLEAHAAAHEHEDHSSCSGHDHETQHDDHSGHNHSAHEHSEHKHDHTGHDHSEPAHADHAHHKSKPAVAKTLHDHSEHAHSKPTHGHEDHHDHAHAHDRPHHADEHGHDDHSNCNGHEDTEHAGHDHGEEAHDHQVIKRVEDILVGDRVLVRPGQRIPVDGEITKGISSINQAPVTGENMPVLKQVGDEVMAGTVNGEAALELRVTRPAAEGTIARIARLVEQAQSQRSPAERFIDRFARYYTPAVVALAILVVAVPVLLFAQPFLDTADGTRGWLYRGLTLLIIACPCALVISIPVTVVSGMTRLAQLGVLVKSGALLDRMADVRIVAFDKTGTLTYGKPAVVSMHTIDCEHTEDNSADCDPCDRLVRAAASVERSSEHPVAHAIVTAAGNRPGVGHVVAANEVTAIPGKGISGIKSDCGHKISVGSADMFTHEEAGWNDVNRVAQKAQAAGQTMMYVQHNQKVVGYIGVQDEIREDSRKALDKLAALSPPVRRVMLTGDNKEAAERVARQIGGIDEIHAGLLPAEKLAQIERLHTDDQAVAMVGDGINDAPALARADIGIAMGGGGTAQAMETADVVLMQDDLSHVALALQMARDCRRIVKQNIILSLALKLAFLALAIPGIATLWMAVIADVGATLLVTLNGMRLLRKK